MRINLLLKFRSFVLARRHFYFWTLGRRTYGAFVESESRIKTAPSICRCDSNHSYYREYATTPPPFTPPFNPPSYSSRNAPTYNVNDRRCATTGKKNHDRWRLSIYSRSLFYSRSFFPPFTRDRRAIASRWLTHGTARAAANSRISSASRNRIHGRATEEDYLSYLLEDKMGPSLIARRDASTVPSVPTSLISTPQHL